MLALTGLGGADHAGQSRLDQLNKTLNLIDGIVDNYQVVLDEGTLMAARAGVIDLVVEVMVVWIIFKLSWTLGTTSLVKPPTLVSEAELG